MKKTLAIIGGALAVLVAAVLIYAATKPDVFRIQRSASIKAPPEKIAAVLGDFRGWQAWSQWEKMDPAMKRDYGGAEKGKAVFTLAPKGDATEVNWAMHGPMPYISKVISVFCDMDSVIGKDFEAGLANLKTVAEK
jgi:hypothetical protein